MFKRRQDEVAEWLRRWTANPLGFPRVGSNPIFVDHFLSVYPAFKSQMSLKLGKIEVTYFALSISQVYFLAYIFLMVHLQCLL